MVALWGAGAEAMAAGRGIAEERSYGGRAKAALAALAWGWGGRGRVVRGPGHCRAKVVRRRHADVGGGSGGIGASAVWQRGVMVSWRCEKCLGRSRTEVSSNQE